MKFNLIKAEDNKDNKVCWDTYVLKSNPSIRIILFEDSIVKNKYTLENTQKSGKVVECGSFDSLYRAKRSAISLNEYLSK